MRDNAFDLSQMEIIWPPKQKPRATQFLTTPIWQLAANFIPYCHMLLTALDHARRENPGVASVMVILEKQDEQIGPQTRVKLLQKIDQHLGAANACQEVGPAHPIYITAMQSAHNFVHGWNDSLVILIP